MTSEKITDITSTKKEASLPVLLARTIQEIDQELRLTRINACDAEWPPSESCPAYYDMYDTRFAVTSDPYVRVRFKVKANYNDVNVAEGSLIIALVGPTEHTSWYVGAVVVGQDFRIRVDFCLGLGRLPLRLLPGMTNIQQVLLVTKEMEYREVQIGV